MERRAGERREEVKKRKRESEGGNASEGKGKEKGEVNEN